MTAWLDRLGARVRDLKGWRRVGLAFLAGAISALGFAPVEFFPALLLGFAALVLLLDGAALGERSWRVAALCGWSLRFRPISDRLALDRLCLPGRSFRPSLADAVRHPVSQRAAWRSMPASLARWRCYFWQDGSVAAFDLFALSMPSAEWVRGHVLTGFPWNLQAYGWGASWR